MCRIILCCHCDYDLRGLSEASKCPECGTPIATTLEARKTWGVLISTARYDSVKLGLILVVSAIAGECLVLVASWHAMGQFKPRLGVSILLIGSVVTAILAFVGAIKCAARGYTRFVMGSMLVLTIATILNAYEPIFPSVHATMAWILSANAALGLVLLLRHLSFIPETAMEPRLKMAMRDAGLLFPLVTVPFYVLFWTGWPTVRIGEGALFLSDLIIFVWSLRLFWRFRGQFLQWLPIGQTEPA